MYHTNTNQKSGVGMLLSGKVYFRALNITRDK